MVKKIIIILAPFKIRKYDFERFDFEELKKIENCKVVFHELIDYIYPNFYKVFTNTYENKNIKKFSNFNEWEREINAYKEKFGKNILILNTVNNIDFKSLKVNFFLKKNKIRYLSYSVVRHAMDEKGTFHYKIRWLFKNLIFNQKKIIIYLESVISNLIQKFFNLHPDFFLKCGKKSEQPNLNQNIKTINGNSFDYNMYIKHKKIEFYRKERYGLFLEAPWPVHNDGDFILVGNKTNLKKLAVSWLNSVNNFFDILENKFNLKILIAPHPKIKHLTKYSKLYNGREILDKGLHLSAKNAEIIISRNSGGGSYAAIYKKPKIFIYNNDLKKRENYVRNQKNFADAFGLDLVNIDNFLSKEKLDNLIKFDNEKYKNYLSNFLTSRNDEKPNHTIISEIISDL
jgi:hypothetical protein